MSRKKQRDPPPSFATSDGWHGHFTPMFDDQLNSIAYISLTAVAKEAYIILRQKYKGQYTGNNVVCTYNQFIEQGMSRNSIPKAIKQLVAFGFITYDSGGLEHQPNIYHFSDSWKNILTQEDVKNVKRQLSENEQRKAIANNNLKTIEQS